MNNNRKNIEKILYRIIEEISKENAPIVFKGGLALKDVLKHLNADSEIDRKTVDIDANWTKNFESEQITNLLARAIKRVDNNYEIELYRVPSEGKSMGYKVLDHGMVVTKIDLDIKDNPFYITYQINDIDIKYSSLEKIMADKLSALSNEHALRRVKDLLDIYLILENEDIAFEKIKEILKYDNRVLGDFSTLINNKEQIILGYDKLMGITNKPNFEKVWNKLMDYLLKNNLIK